MTFEEYIMGRDKVYPLTEQMKQDALEVVSKSNIILGCFGDYRKVNSGYRPELINSTVRNAALHSNHIICRAVDIEDVDGKLDFYCMTHQEKLAEIGLWLENPVGTPGWCHVQIVPPRSGHRVFIA